MFSRLAFLRQATLYRYRFFLGYGILIALGIYISTVDLSSIPRGISQSEMNSAVASNFMSLNLGLDWVVNAPYHLLQKFSMMLFGASQFSIVLPSVVIGVLTVIIMTLMLRRWFKESVAIIAAIIVLTSSSFMNMMRDGTPTIMLAFWTMLLLYSSVEFLMQHEKAFIWKILMTIAVAGLMYTPLGPYSLFILVGSGLLHPHIRARYRSVKLYRHIILATLAGILLAPLLIRLFISPNETITAILGLSALPHSLGDIKNNLVFVFEAFFNFSRTEILGGVVTPVYGTASAALILLGFFKLVRDRFTARAYTLLSWMAIVLLLIVLMAGFAIPLILAPAMLLIAIGIEFLINEWYRIFPFNPYARIVGLIPLSVLFLLLTIGNLTAYFNAYRYTSYDGYYDQLGAVRSALHNYYSLPHSSGATLIVPAQQTAFYDILRKTYKDLGVSSTLPADTKGTIIVISPVTIPEKIPTRIYTNDLTKKDSTLVRVYK